MKRRAVTNRRAGCTLLEMIAVMGGLAITLTIGVTLLVVAMKADKVGAATLRQVAWRAELADQFRADVARAVAAPDSLENWTQGPQCLILRLHDGTHVIYEWRDEQLERT